LPGTLLALLLLVPFASGSAAADSCPNAALRAQQGSGFLPDCRASELVSPQLKNGADIGGVPARSRVAADGSAVQFMSLGGFGDVHGSGIATEYMAIRTGAPETTGWSTHGITPGNLAAGTLIEAIAFPAESRYMGEFSPDLSDGVFFANSDFTHTSTTVAGLPNLALRTDLRTAGAGNYQLVSDCNGCAGPLPSPNPKDGQPALAGTSADFGDVVFESREPLAPGPVSPCTPVFFQTSCPPQLYEWSGGVVRLAGWVPPAGASECGPAPLPACVAAANSQAGDGARNRNFTPDTISADGSRIIFTVVNTAGTNPAGTLYMRIDNGKADARTMQLNTSERTTPDIMPADAQYWAASSDDSRVFFTTNENLVDGDNSTENNADLYEYNVTPDAQGHHLRLVSVDQVGSGENVDGVIGASADGGTVYFLAVGQLVAGEPTATDGERIYRWTDGVLHYVAKANQNALQRLTGFAGTGGWEHGQPGGRVSPDGTRLLFASQGTDELPHTGVGDTCGAAHDQACIELFLYDASANNGQGSVVCASCAQPDGPASADASFSTNLDKGAADGTSHLNHPLSDDGRYVFFDTTAALVPGDQDGLKPDVYEYDSLTGQLHLLSAAKPGSFGASFVDASPSGDDVFLATRDRLSPWDIDDNTDLYDIRVNGGIPGPLAVAPACASDTCRPPQPNSPVFTPTGSGTIVGSGNLRPAKPTPHVVHCARGKVRKRVHGKVRCVAKKKPAHHKSVGRARRAAVHQTHKAQKRGR
jgi:hypothetical protein